jgi:hypothetical protein
MEVNRVCSFLFKSPCCAQIIKAAIHSKIPNDVSFIILKDLAVHLRAL